MGKMDIKARMKELEGEVAEQEGEAERDIRRLYVERALAIVTTAAQTPNALFMDALEQFIAGEISLGELESNVDQFMYLKKKGDE